MVLIGAQCKMPKGLLKIQNTVFQFMPESSFHNLGLSKKALFNYRNPLPHWILVKD
jgi:hypothetical protein